MQPESPGTFQFTWNGRDQNGKIVPDGEYEIVFKTIELNYNYPPSNQTIFKVGTINVVNGEYNIPEWRMKEIVTSASFDSPTISPNGDGIEDKVSGNVTISEPVKVTVYIATALGNHMNHVIYFKELKPGPHSFTWDGTEYMGGKALNGNYYIKVMVTEKSGATGFLMFDTKPVTVKEMTTIKALEPIQQVRVITEKTQMKVYPMDQVSTATKGEIFKLISKNQENGYYEVLVKEGIPGTVKVTDVEIVHTETPEPKKPIKYLYHTVESGDTLWKIATKYGVTIQDLLEVNSLDINKPILVGQVIKIPVKNNELPDTPPNTIIHTVQAGDTLWKIAQKYQTSINEIVKINNLNPSQYLYIGQQLKVPVQQDSQQPIENDTVHIVQAGDTLWKIAQKYQTSINEIVKINNLDPSQYLYIGQQLKIPVQQGTQQPIENHTVYIVQPGDTLWKIANKYSVTIQDIVELNQLNVDQYLTVGQKLMIPVKQQEEKYTMYTVQPGDTLWIISQKYNTTIQKIADLNQIDVEKPIFVGQTLKVPSP